MGSISNQLTWKQLAKLLGVMDPETKAEQVWDNCIEGDYSWTKSEALQLLGSEATEEEIEIKSRQLEQECIDHECDKYNTKYREAIKHVFIYLCKEHELDLIEINKKGKESYFEIHPLLNQGWASAAHKLIKTINGYGMFEFQNVKDLVRSGPYKSIKQAVLQHLHWIVSYSEVYEGTKCCNLVMNRMR